MSLAFTHLGTGSRGNATLVESGDAKVLIDQGFSGKQLETRLARMDIRPQEIDAIVLTHHHGDHGGGASIAQRRWDIPIILDCIVIEPLFNHTVVIPFIGSVVVKVDFS